MKKLLITMGTAGAAALLLGVGWLYAQEPAAPLQVETNTTSTVANFTYQGRLVDALGAVDGNCDFEFRLYDVPTDGLQLGGTVAQSNVSVADGLLAVELGFGAAFDGSDRYLEIGVRCPTGSGAFATLSPRQHITPAPHAIFAISASVAGDLECTGCVSESELDFTADGGDSWSLTGNAGTSAGANFIGTTDFQPLELHVGGFRAFRLEPGLRPNIIGGFDGNSVTGGASGGTVGGGGVLNDPNVVRGDFGTVGGGMANEAFFYATVSGGRSNAASDEWSTVGGGDGNTASGKWSTVGGGDGNLARRDGATVAGGINNDSGLNAFIGGGVSNLAGSEATVSGGRGNTASQSNTVIGGGLNNLANGANATVGGGEGNAASHLWAVVGGGQGNSATRQWAVIGGGESNTASGDWAVVGGGKSNTASGDWAVVGGGDRNVAAGKYATIAGGGPFDDDGVFQVNHVTDDYGTIGGGADNQAGNGNTSSIDARGATVAGGLRNSALESTATVSGGFDNIASGKRSTVPGGEKNIAAADYSFAAGQNAEVKPLHTGSFVYSDRVNSSDPFFSFAANTFNVRSTGGARFVSAISGGTVSAGVKLFAGGTSWSALSDRAVKTNFAAVDARQIAEAVAAMPITSWNVKAQDPSIRHLGPMAQDFREAFGLGESDRHISSIDADGVALAAIQGLYEMVQERDARIEELEVRLDALEGGSDLSDGGRWNVPFGLAESGLLGLAIAMSALALAWSRRAGGETSKRA